MTILIDNSKAVEISICEWDDESHEYGPDWSADFFTVGNLESIDGPEPDCIPAYIVEDVDYCIEQANDMVAGEGDFAEDGPQPDTFVDVTELDRSAYPICEIDLYQLSIVRMMSASCFRQSTQSLSCLPSCSACCLIDASLAYPGSAYPRSAATNG